MSASCIYEGTITHERSTPPARSFTYPLFMVYLDLDDLDRAMKASLLFSTSRPAIFWLRRADHFGDTGESLAEAARREVERQTGQRPTGPVRLLTHLRTLGHWFNPVSFFYCHGATGELDAVIAEVTNTPWRERCLHVLPRSASVDADRLRFRFEKRFHVSPFFGMDMTYDWELGLPGETLGVRMKSFEHGVLAHDARLHLARRPLDERTLASALARFPLLTCRVIAAIYWQALRLFLAGARFYPHPKTVVERA